MSFRSEQLIAGVRSGLPCAVNNAAPMAVGLEAWYLPESVLYGGNVVPDISGRTRNASVGTGSGSWGWKNGIYFDGTYSLNGGQDTPFDGDNFACQVDMTFLPGWNSGYRRFFNFYRPTLWTNSGSFGIVHEATLDATFTPPVTVANYSRHVWTFSRQGTTFRVFQDGLVAYESTSWSVSWSKTGSVFFAQGDTGYPENAPMILHEARLYSRPLSINEVRGSVDPQTRYDILMPVGWQVGPVARGAAGASAGAGNNQIVIIG